MLNISHLYKLLLSKDIEININSIIENIKNANKWSDLDVKSACEKIDITTLKVNDIKYHAALLENISKLSVDLLLDYDYYKNFTFKRQFESVDYDEKLKKLGYEIEDDYWHNVNKPSKDTIIMNVFLSCLYNNLIEIMPNIDECLFCDTRIKPDDERCSVCCELVANMSILNNSYNRKSNNSDINQAKIDKVHFWICKECTFQNENRNNKCSICESLNIVETEWKCWNKNCERMNKIEHNYCQTCKLDKNPPDPETKLLKSYIGKKMREIWICRKCEKCNPGDNFKCEGKNCGSFRFYTGDDSQDNTMETVKSNKIETNPIQWECYKCTFNNNDDDRYCIICDSERNDNYNCDIVGWKCWFANCKQINDDQYEFCENCKLDRFGCNDRGALVKCQDKNGIKEVWICQKCFNYNSLSNEICGGNYCNYSRF